MGLTVADLRAAASAAYAGMQAAEAELNAADRALGDGDTGVTLRRVFEKIANATGSTDDIGVYLKAVGMAAAGATGSSLGTLFAVSFLEIAKAEAGATSLAAEELGGLLAQARDTMMARGRASLGDKTVLDSVDAVSRAIAGVSEADELAKRAVAAARSALDEFRARPCRIGRARMFAEKSTGLDDPGMLAFVRLVEAVTGAA